MTLAGVAATWSALILAVIALLTALGASSERPYLRDLASRALFASAFASLSAAITLGVLLAQTRLDVAFVAAHVTRNMAVSDRVATMLTAPSGSALPTAALVAALGALRARRRRECVGLAVSAATALALVAASVAAEPFQRLSWQPAEGLGVLPWLVDNASVLGRIALMGAIATASLIAAYAADDLAEEAQSRDASGDAARLTTLAALLAIGIVSSSIGAFSAGGAPSPAPVTPFARYLLVALLTSTLATRAHASSPLAALLGGVGGVGLLVGALLLNGAPRPSLPVFLFCTAAVLAAAGGSLVVSHSRARGAAFWWRALLDFGLAVAAISMLWWPPDARRSESISVWSAVGATIAYGVHVWWRLALTRPTAQLFLLLALALTSLAALGERLSTTREFALAGGERVIVDGSGENALSIEHQGLSRFERPTAHVEALGLGVHARGIARLIVAERRDYVDTRQNPIALGVARPAVTHIGVTELRVVLDSVGADERATVSVTLAPFAWGWLAAVMVAVVAALISWVARPLHNTINTGEPLRPPAHV